MSYQRFETDWLSSRPIFYNEVTKKVSDNVKDVIDTDDVVFHPEGLNNYLDYGYSVFGQTPVQDVKFLPPNSRLTISKDQITVESLPDPIEYWENKTTTPEEALEQLEDFIQKWEKSVQGNIVIPTSGGYDSRLLNYFIKDKSRVRTFTYGISRFQENSFEANYAHELSNILGTQWQRVELGDFHKYIEAWNQLFGVSTHAHGMYHIEFYYKISQFIDTVKAPLLSGIVGDIWAGSITYNRFSTVEDLKKLSYNHSMHADSKYSLLKSSNFLKENYLSQNKEKLNDEFFQVVELVRFKMILLCYLLKVPKNIYGFDVWSPFLSPEVALSMLTIPSKYRQNRLWQKNFFDSHGLALEKMNLGGSRLNDLNYRAMMMSPLRPLDVNVLSRVMKRNYVEWINRKVRPFTTFSDVPWKARRIPRVSGGLRRIGIQNPRLKAYFAYLTLKPIESLLLAQGKS